MAIDGSQCTAWDGSTAKTALGPVGVLNLLLISLCLLLHFQMMTLDYISYFRKHMKGVGAGLAIESGFRN